MNNNSIHKLYEFAIETAYLAGKLTLGYFQAGVSADYKPDNSPVTAADRAAEELIRSRIEKAYPHHAIIGEEFGEDPLKTASHRWIIDPIDGTKAFLRGVPLYGVLIGLEIEGQVQVGVACFPALGEIIAAATGLGCWWNGRRAYVSMLPDLSQAYLTTTNLQSFIQHNRQAALNRLLGACYHHAGWSDAYGYLLVASGRAEIMLDPIMNIWDCGPFPVIFQEAGGYFGDWHGNPTIYNSEALATTQTLLPQVLQLIEEE